MIGARRQAAAGTPVGEVCRTRGITEQRCSRGKRHFAGLGVAALRRLRQVEEEHRRLKPLVAERPLDQPMRQEAIRKTRCSRPSNGRWCGLCRSAVA